MGLRFRRSVRLFPGVRINLSRSGISTSVGVRGAHVTVGAAGTRTTVGLPGTGLSYTRLQKAGPKPQEASEELVQTPAILRPRRSAVRGWLLIALILVAIVLTVWGQR